MNNNVNKKNIAKGFFERIELDDGFFILIHKNESSVKHFIERHINFNFIQFHFCLKGFSQFIFNEGRYALDLHQDNSLLLYNPERDLPIQAQTKARTYLISIIISIKKFHSLFSQEANYITFLSEENKHKKYYKQIKTLPSIVIILNQIINFKLNESLKPLYLKAKSLELLSLYFNTGKSNIDQCPFLADETNVIKIRKAKDIVINKMTEPPSLQELANEIGLSLKKLKEGFKQIYGDSVFSFLLDYKMETARKLLESGNHNVNEVALRLGYSTSSHFISAFKKKYGTTPKKYVMTLV